MSDPVTLAAAPAVRPGARVAVLERGTYVELALPSHGDLAIGTAPSAWIRLLDPRVMPEHAVLHVEPSGMRLSAIAGRTSVNGEVLEGARALALGDIVSVGAATIVFRAEGEREGGRVLAAAEARRRFEQEVERAVRYGRPLAVMVVDPGNARDAPPVDDAIGLAVRNVDVIGAGAGRERFVLMPETTAEAARIPARRLVASLAERVQDVRIGVAAFPTHGSDWTELLANARRASRGAAPATVGELSPSPRAWTAGDVTIVAHDPSMARLLAVTERLAASDITVLVHGETGVGKELIAKALHAWSPRRDAPLVALNCAAIPEALLESELFGYERGAFSGANTAKAGLLESAAGGTVFLDEIGECSPSAQAKLLRVLETHRVARVGALATRAIDVRVVAATNRALEREVEAGRFRQDLFFRLCGAQLVVPPLRERPLDLVPLAEAFLDEACKRERRERLSLGPAAIERVRSHAWPGNARELRNAMSRVAATALGPEVEAADLDGMTSGIAFRADSPAATPRERPNAPFRPLYDEIRELEARRIREALEATAGVRVRAAELIGLPLRTLVTKIKEYGLADAGTRAAPREVATPR